jgi:hypothetical protein
MFETEEFGASLGSILASPPEASGDRSPFDSVVEDSAFTDSVFGYDDHHQSNGYMLPANHFQPIPELSVDVSRRPAKEDDTMISVSFFYNLADI